NRRQPRPDFRVTDGRAYSSLNNRQRRQRMSETQAAEAQAAATQAAEAAATGQKIPNAQELKELAAKLQDLLRIRTLPIGMKQFETIEDMERIQGLRRPKPGRFHTTCLLVTQARMAGFTLGITTENVRPNSNCGGVMGIDMPDEATLSGERMDGVWFQNREAAHAHQQQMPRQTFGKYVATVVSPLRSARLDPPDIVLFYGTPGQVILFVNGLQWKRYKRYDMSITGESACADSWGRA